MLLGVHVDSLGAISVHLPPPWYLVITSLGGQAGPLSPALPSKVAELRKLERESLVIRG